VNWRFFFAIMLGSDSELFTFLYIARMIILEYYFRLRRRISAVPLFMIKPLTLADCTTSDR
jgi:hypothetical protein